MTQGDDAWIKARLGKVTASRMADVTARLKNGSWGASRDNYIAELVVERLYGQPYPQYVSAAMISGTEREPDARAAYAFATNTEVIEVGFVPHPSIEMTGASPDGLVGSEGLVEIKCMEPKGHIKTLHQDYKIDDGYIKQMQWQMACTDRQWCDFVAYNPHFEQEALQIIRVYRNEEVISYLERDVRAFLADVDHEVNFILKRRGKQAA